MKHHSSWPLALSLALALGSASATAQQLLDPARMRPIEGPVRPAGTFDWDTKTWLGAGQAQPWKPGGNRTTVYRNDCTWTGGGFSYSIEHCEDVVDTGRLPASNTPLSSLQGNPQALVGVLDDQIINRFQFSYCTSAPRGQVEIQVGFYDNLRGFCAGDVPVQGKPLGLTLAEQAAAFGNRTAYFDFGRASDYPLPGSSVLGIESCWAVAVTFSLNNGFCLQSEGDGRWDNDADVDLFSWSFGHDLPASTFGATGVLIAGEPSAGGYGAGAYNIPLGTSGVFGGNCGTGFGNTDGYWLNVDASAPGSFTTATGAGSCPGAAPFGTGCYWFGGWPGAPLGSFHLVLEAVGSCSGCNNRAVSYCSAGTSALGCRALLSTLGASSASAASGFFLQTDGAPGQGEGGMFFYGSSGRQSQPWGNGNSFLCVVPPLARTPVSTPPPSGACTGSHRLDLNAFWSAYPQRNPGPGAVVQAQLWYRDSQNTSSQETALSNAVEWVVCP